MAQYHPFSTGLWSTRTNWVTGANSTTDRAGKLPGPEDDVFSSNNNTVTIDVDNIHINSLQRGQGLFNIFPGQERGTFLLSNNIRFRANFIRSTGFDSQVVPLLQFNSALGPTTSSRCFVTVSSITAFNNACFSIGHNSPGTMFLTATGGIFLSNTVSNFGGYDAHAVTNNSTGTLFITGNCYGPNGPTGTSVRGGPLQGYTVIRNFSNGTVTLSGDIISPGGPFSNSSGACNMGVSGIFIVFGDVTGGESSSSYGLTNTNTGSAYIYGRAKGGLRGPGVINNSTGFCFVDTVEGNGWGLLSESSLVQSPGYASVPGLLNNNINGRSIARRFICGIRGQWPTQGNVYLTLSGGALATFRTIEGNTVTTFFPFEANEYQPLTRDVRLGTVFGGNTFNGTLAMPLSTEVIFGAPVDNTTGVGFLEALDAWNVKTSNIFLTGSMGFRVKRGLTINSLSALVTVMNA